MKTLSFFIFISYLILPKATYSQEENLYEDVDYVLKTVKYFKYNEAYEKEVIYELISSTDKDAPAKSKKVHEHIDNMNKFLAVKQNIINITDSLYKQLYNNNCFNLAEAVFKSRKFINICLEKNSKERIVKLEEVLRMKDPNFDSNELASTIIKAKLLMEDCNDILEYYYENDYDKTVDDLQKAIILEECK